jgi:hypothetical protein
MDLDDAADVLAAEAARSRLGDRTGPARVWLRCGQVLAGVLGGAPPVEDALALTTDLGVVVVPTRAVVCVIGGQPGLRDEADRPGRLSRGLREAWSAAGSVRVLLRDGGWVAGPVTWVGADHAVLGGTEPVAVPFAAADAWLLPAD